MNILNNRVWTQKHPTKSICSANTFKKKNQSVLILLFSKYNFRHDQISFVNSSQSTSGAHMKRNVSLQEDYFFSYMYTYISPFQLESYYKLQAYFKTKKKNENIKNYPSPLHGDSKHQLYLVNRGKPESQIFSSLQHAHTVLELVNKSRFLRIAPSKSSQFIFFRNY